ncbi:MAG: MATE family efflux transporter [Streptococcaceae bacterium]|nr:MATE family efflux transporter [Streptococcaceae bacterium]
MDFQVAKVGFFKEVLALALPVALQGMLYSILGIVDQLMVGQLGDAAVVAVSLASRNFGVLNFALMGLTGGLGILAAQFLGNRMPEKIAKIEGMALAVGILLALIFMVLSVGFPEWCMRLFTADKAVIGLGVTYHQTFAWSYLPIALIAVYSTVLRNAKRVKLPMYAGFLAVLIDAGLNWIFVFGNLGAPRLGVAGSGLATAISCWIELAVLAGFIFGKKLIGSYPLSALTGFLSADDDIKKFWRLTAPLLIENISFTLMVSVVNAIYGFMGTAETVAVTVMGPVETLLITFFGGFSTAASVLIGHHLGRSELSEAYGTARRILWLGFFASFALSALMIAISPRYISLYRLTDFSSALTQATFVMMAIFIPIKVTNMIVTGGVLAAGGETWFILWQSLISWALAVPLGYLTAFVWHWPIYLVFAAISFEEIVRVVWCLAKFRKKTWLNNLVET